MEGEVADVTVQLPYGIHHRVNITMHISVQGIFHKPLLLVYDSSKLGLDSISCVCPGLGEGLRGFVRLRLELLLQVVHLLQLLLQLCIAFLELCPSPFEQRSQIVNFIWILSAPRHFVVGGIPGL